MVKEAKIALEDGTILKGEAFGSTITKTGEVVFSTGMTGYVESLTDPSFCGQILMPTYPLQGNVGVKEEWFQSEGIKAEGLIVREVCKKPTVYSSQKTLDDFLKEENIPGISGIDTRYLTLKIREKGAMKGAISTEEISDEELLKLAKNQKSITEQDLVPRVSSNDKRIFLEDADMKVAILDFGIKNAMIKAFTRRGIGVEIYPYNTPSSEILKENPAGLFISSGPGNPERVIEAKETLLTLAERLPVLGVCLGQQIMANAYGGKTYKMKFGHRGSNQPVKSLETGKVYITSQNHGFAISAESLEKTPLEVSHINLNDNTVEGIHHKELPLLCVQYHPEAGPGSNDTSWIFDDFVKTMKEF